MNVLGIDTSTKKANVCISKENNIISKSIDNEITHSEKLLPLIDKTLKEAAISMQDINYLACSIGPGSFTGIRIGIATVKAFAKVLNVPIFAVSSLDVNAYTDTKNEADYVISIMDSKNSRIYYSVYKVNYKGKLKVLEPILNPSNDDIDIAFTNIKSCFSKKNISSISSLKIIGDCADTYKEQFVDNLDYLCNNISIYNNYISGETLVTIAKNYITTGYDNTYKKDYLTLDALYVRPSQAERAKNNEL